MAQRYCYSRRALNSSASDIRVFWVQTGASEVEFWNSILQREWTFTNFHVASRLILAQARGNELKWLNFPRLYCSDNERQHILKLKFFKKIIFSQWSDTRKCHSKIIDSCSFYSGLDMILLGVGNAIQDWLPCPTVWFLENKGYALPHQTCHCKSKCCETGTLLVWSILKLENCLALTGTHRYRLFLTR